MGELLTLPHAARMLDSLAEDAHLFFRTLKRDGLSMSRLTGYRRNQIVEGPGVPPLFYRVAVYLVYIRALYEYLYVDDLFGVDYFVAHPFAARDY